MGCSNLTDHQLGSRKRQKLLNELKGDGEKVVGTAPLGNFDLYEARLACVKQLQSSFEDIILRYEKEFPDDDEIDLRTGRITVNNGHLDKLQQAIRESCISDEGEEDDESGDQDFNEALALARPEEGQSLHPATDPLWQAPDLPEVNHNIDGARQQAKQPPSCTPSQAMFEFERRRNHHFIRRGKLGRGVLSQATRTRNNLTPTEIQLLVTLKKKNATWDEVYSLLPHRQHDIIRQWYRKLKVDPGTPENWTDECQKSLNDLVLSTPHISWSDLYSMFDGISRRKLKSLWLETCLASAGLQPSPDWENLTEYGPGDGHVNRSSGSRKTSLARDRATSPDQGTQKPDSSPNPHKDAGPNSVQEDISVAPFDRDDAVVLPCLSGYYRNEVQTSITNNATPSIGSPNGVRSSRPTGPQKGLSYRRSGPGEGEKTSSSPRDLGQPHSGDDDTHNVPGPEAVATTTLLKTIADVKQPRKRGRARKHSMEQRPSTTTSEWADTEAVPLMTPATSISTPLSSVGTRKCSRRASTPSSIPRKRNPKDKAQSDGVSAAKTGKAFQPRTPKTPSQVQEESDSDDPLSMPFTTVRPISRR
ncbi:hypothetical protein KEM54_005548 [Ascosphaera aggregata]|nr:hypothetical protein KEM54_005548 [Ascosphaera aggregata]